MKAFYNYETCHQDMENIASTVFIKTKQNEKRKVLLLFCLCPSIIMLAAGAIIILYNYVTFTTHTCEAVRHKKAFTETKTSVSCYHDNLNTP